MDRIRDWLIGSDPGWLRLQMAGRTTLTLAVTLGVLYVVTGVAGVPFTVALLGVVISMMIAMAVNEPDPRQRLITTALLPLPAAATVTLGALLAGRAVLGDIVFVLIMVAAVLARRFGSRGMAMGMAAFMTYFFALFLGATMGQLPWLIAAIVMGAAISYLMRTFVLPDRPDRVLRRTLRAVLVRIGDLVESTADAVRRGGADERAARRLRSRARRLNETVTMAETQLEETVDAAELRPGMGDDDLTFRLFDVELAAERLVESGTLAAAAAPPLAAREELVPLLEGLRAALRDRAPAGELRTVQERLQHRVPTPLPGPATPPSGSGRGQEPDPTSRLLLAGAHLAGVSAELGELTDQAQTGGRRQPVTPHVDATDEEAAGKDPAADENGEDGQEEGDEKGGEPNGAERLSPLTRQAIQVGIAAALAVLAGELLSPARWYWAAIATFVIFTGTSSRGEVLTKGWQRLLGTAAGVPAGVLIATAAGGNTTASLLLIFVCIFLAFYLIQIAYGWMIFWITAMLALLYGMLGQFSVGLLDLRLEETAIGAGIGVLVAATVLPTRTRSTIADRARDFLDALRGLVETSTSARTVHRSEADPIDEARELHRMLQELRAAAEPVAEGVAGMRGRGSTRRFLRLMTVCDHYGRSLARAANRTAEPSDEQLARKMDDAGQRIAGNIEAVMSALDDPRHADVRAVAELLDSAEVALTARHEHQGRDVLRSRSAIRSLRHIDRAVIDLAGELGADIGPGSGAATSSRLPVATSG